MAVEKIKILGAVLELTDKLIQPIWPNFEVKGLDCQCCLAGSSKTAPRIFIFSIVLGAEYLSDVKSIETHACTFLPLYISAVGSVHLSLIKQDHAKLKTHRACYNLNLLILQETVFYCLPRKQCKDLSFLFRCCCKSASSWSQTSKVVSSHTRQ